MRIRSVRGVFAEGPPAFPGSFLSEGSHVQVAVRDADVISDARVVQAGGADHPARRVVDPEDAGERMRLHLRQR